MEAHCDSTHIAESPDQERTTGLCVLYGHFSVPQRREQLRRDSTKTAVDLRNVCRYRSWHLWHRLVESTLFPQLLDLSVESVDEDEAWYRT
jgi:hypothetical protein